MNGPPPFPNFLVASILAVFTFLKFEFLNENVLPPPFPQLQNVITIIVTVLQILTDRTPLILALFPGMMFHRNTGKDVWTFLQRDPRNFWYLTGETPSSMDSIVQTVADEVCKPRMIPRVPISARRRPCILDVRNRVLLVLIWLRIYPTYVTLASIFQIRKSTVHEEIYHVVPILFLHFRRFVTWHNLRQWSSFMGHWKHYRNAVGLIDATIHRIRRPSGKAQAEFYRGDKKTHFMSTQLIVDADGMIVLLVSG